jgi:peptidylprolyl isomerase
VWYGEGMFMKRVAILLCFIFIVLSSGCTTNDAIDSELSVKSGDYITVNYTGRLTDGTVFDTSIKEIAVESQVYKPQREYKPLGFVVGSGRMITGFDNAVVGMGLGEEKVVTIPPEEAYGPCRSELLIDIPQEDFANANITPVIGQKITSSRFEGIITEISENNVIIDCNSPLAGETLVFTIEIVSIEPSNV